MESQRRSERTKSGLAILYFWPVAKLVAVKRLLSNNMVLCLESRCETPGLKKKVLQGRDRGGH